MRWSIWLAVFTSIIPATAVLAQQPTQSIQAAPWANKFFLADIGTNREQPAPAVITHNFGEVPHGTLCVHKFTITNIYDVPVQITEVRKSCTCLDYVPMTKTLQPNEPAEFTVTMNTGKFVGFNAQTFYVTFGPKYVSTAVIRLQATSRTDVSLTPGAVAFGTVPVGTQARQSVAVKYTGRSRDWRLLDVAPIQGPFDVAVAEVSRGGPFRGGAEYQVSFTLKADAKPGSISEQVSIRTNDTAHPVVQLAVSGTVAAPVEVAPKRVRFAAVPVGQSASQRVLVRAAKPFKVLGVEGAGEGITVEVPPTTAALPVQFITIRFDAKTAGTVSRTLRIRTDIDGAVASVPVDAEAVLK
jgi:hypothetical protein